MKTWLRSDEWVGHSLCRHDSRFITAPERMSQDDVEEVRSICYRCPVRPECIKHNTVDHEESGVWCASEWIEEVALEAPPRLARQAVADAEITRLMLSKSLEDELGRRGAF
jgi:hypothetical protein